jgi:hypothetical protein
MFHVKHFCKVLGGSRQAELVGSRAQTARLYRPAAAL